MSELFTAIIYTLLVIFITVIITFDDIYTDGQISVASGLQLCEIVGDVREDKTIETKWVCKHAKGKYND